MLRQRIERIAEQRLRKIKGCSIPDLRRRAVHEGFALVHNSGLCPHYAFAALSVEGALSRMRQAQNAVAGYIEAGMRGRRSAQLCDVSQMRALPVAFQPDKKRAAHSGSRGRIQSAPERQARVGADCRRLELSARVRAKIPIFKGPQAVFLNGEPVARHRTRQPGRQAA